MTKERVTMLEIGQATLQEREGVMALLRANYADNLGEAERRDGFVTTNMTPEQMTAPWPAGTSAASSSTRPRCWPSPTRAST